MNATVDNISSMEIISTFLCNELTAKLTEGVLKTACDKWKTRIENKEFISAMGSAMDQLHTSVLGTNDQY